MQNSENTILVNNLDLDFINEIAFQPGGENIKRCYACGTCTISCPVFELDEKYNPRKIIRMALLGLREELLSSDIIWMCANCYTCFERCPQDVRFTSIVHTIRNIAIKEAKEGKRELKSPTFLFAKLFLNSAKVHGRVWEPELVTRLLFAVKDIKKALGFIPLGIKMLKKGKLPFLPARIKNRKEIKEIFEKIEKL